MKRIILFIAVALTAACVFAQAPTITKDNARALIADDFKAYIAGKPSALGWKAAVVTARDLHAAYDANEVAADKRYATAPSLSVTGTVRAIDKTIGDTALLRLNGTNPYFGPAAVMADGYEDWLGTLKRGDRVALGCLKVRRSLTLVQLYDCMPQAVYIERAVTGYVQSLPRRVKEGDTRAAAIYAALK